MEKNDIIYFIYRYMKLSRWAKQEDISYRTAHRWFKSGKLPVKSYQTKTGSIFVKEDINSHVEENISIYCRVSSHNKKDDLNRQIERCKIFCLNRGLTINNIYKEVASGMNDNRKQLNKMLDNNHTTIIVENKDRLTRFGFNYLKKLLFKLNTEILVINNVDEDKNDLMKDLISIITSFTSRYYGLRRSQNKKKQLLNILNDKD